VVGGRCLGRELPGGGDSGRAQPARQRTWGDLEGFLLQASAFGRVVSQHLFNALPAQPGEHVGEGGFLLLPAGSSAEKQRFSPRVWLVSLDADSPLF